MGIWLDGRLRNWRYEFQFRGKRYTGSGFRSHREAEVGRDERQRAVRKVWKQTPQGMALRQAASLYLDYAERRFVRQTYLYKRGVLQGLANHLGDVPLDEVQPQDIHVYLSTRPTNHNYNVHRKELLAFWNYYIRRLKIASVNPVAEIDRMPEQRAERIVPTTEEVRRLLDIAGAYCHGREKPLLLTVIHTMGRIDEVLRLKWTDVDFERSTVQLWTQKSMSGMRADPLPMNQELYAVLREVYSRIQPHSEGKANGFILQNHKTRNRFVSRPKLMKALCKKAGIRHFGFHALRHWAATFLADQGVARKTLSSLLRHRSLATTEIYLHRIEESQREAMDRLSQCVGQVCGSDENRGDSSVSGANNHP